MGRDCSILGEDEVVMSKVYDSEYRGKQLAVEDIREVETAQLSD